MKLFLDRMIHPKISTSTTLTHAVEKLTDPPLPPVNPRSVIYRIVITDKTGRFEDE